MSADPKPLPLADDAELIARLRDHSSCLCPDDTGTWDCTVCNARRRLVQLSSALRAVRELCNAVRDGQVWPHPPGSFVQAILSAMESAK